MNSPDCLHSIWFVYYQCSAFTGHTVLPYSMTLITAKMPTQTSGCSAHCPTILIDFNYCKYAHSHFTMHTFGLFNVLNLLFTGTVGTLSFIKNSPDCLHSIWFVYYQCSEFTGHTVLPYSLTLITAKMPTQTSGCTLMF